MWRAPCAVAGADRPRSPSCHVGHASARARTSHRRDPSQPPILRPPAPSCSGAGRRWHHRGPQLCAVHRQHRRQGGARARGLGSCTRAHMATLHALPHCCACMCAHQPGPPLLAPGWAARQAARLRGAPAPQPPAGPSSPIPLDPHLAPNPPRSPSCPTLSSWWASPSPAGSSTATSPSAPTGARARAPPRARQPPPHRSAPARAAAQCPYARFAWGPWPKQPRCAHMIAPPHRPIARFFQPASPRDELFVTIKNLWTKIYGSTK